MELMVVISILGLALAASWGSVRDMMEQHRVQSAASQLATHLRLARERAVAEGNHYVVTFRQANNDYEVWDDLGSDAIAGPNEVQRLHAMPSGTVLLNPQFFGSNQLTFRADGTTDASGSVSVQSGASQRRIDVLASTGRVTVSIP
jgi:Tfp pilus assembly protein FimT